MPENNNSIFDKILFTLYLIFFVSLVFSLRAICSISIGVILITGFIKNKMEYKTFFSSNLKNLLLASCCLFLLLELASLLYTNNTHEGWKNIRVKSALIIIPLSLC